MVAVARTVDSTNTQFWRIWGNTFFQPWTVFGADIQSAGRGQRGRNWYSPANGNLYFTVGLPDVARSNFPLVPLLMGLGFVQAFPMEKVYLKWPNDLLDAEGRKLGGILMESFNFGNKIRLIAGIGVNLAEDSSLLDGRNLSGALGHGSWLQSRNVAFGRIIGGLAQIWDKWQEWGFLPLIQGWQNSAYGIGRKIAVTTEEGIWRGVFIGVDQAGRLLITTRREHLAFHSGDLSFF